MPNSQVALDSAVRTENYSAQSSARTEKDERFRAESFDRAPYCGMLNVFNMVSKSVQNFVRTYSRPSGAFSAVNEDKVSLIRTRANSTVSIAGSLSQTNATSAGALERSAPPMTVTQLNGIADDVKRIMVLNLCSESAKAEFSDTDPRYATSDGALGVFMDRAISENPNELLLVGFKKNAQDGSSSEWVGTISLCEWDEPKFEKHGPRWVADFVVKEDSRGQGYGSQLLKQVLDAARERGFPDVKLYTESEDAMRLYARNGFQFIESEIVTDNTNPDNEIKCYIMRADLSSQA
jgi:GNAT superfamily N-acetyltransferase